MCNEGRCIKLTSFNNNNKVGKGSEVAAGYNKHENAIPPMVIDRLDINDNKIIHVN